MRAQRIISGVAPPSVLTAELRAKIERELATGAKLDVVGQRVGVTGRTLERWLAAGKIVRRRLEPVSDDAPPPVPQLPVSERIAQAEPGLVGEIIAAAKRGHWQAAAWLLERATPERWGKRDANAMPAELRDAFSEIDEIAEQRRGKKR